MRHTIALVDEALIEESLAKEDPEFRIFFEEVLGHQLYGVFTPESWNTLRQNNKSSKTGGKLLRSLSKKLGTYSPEIKPSVSFVITNNPEKFSKEFPDVPDCSIRYILIQVASDRLQLFTWLNELAIAHVNEDCELVDVYEVVEVEDAYPVSSMANLLIAQEPEGSEELEKSVQLSFEAERQHTRNSEPTVNWTQLEALLRRGKSKWRGNGASSVFLFLLLTLLNENTRALVFQLEKQDVSLSPTPNVLASGISQDFSTTVSLGQDIVSSLVDMSFSTVDQIISILKPFFAEETDLLPLPNLEVLKDLVVDANRDRPFSLSASSILGNAKSASVFALEMYRLSHDSLPGNLPSSIVQHTSELVLNTFGRLNVEDPKAENLQHSFLTPITSQLDGFEANNATVEHDISNSDILTNQESVAAIDDSIAQEPSSENDPVPADTSPDEVLKVPEDQLNKPIFNTPSQNNLTIDPDPVSPPQPSPVNPTLVSSPQIPIVVPGPVNPPHPSTMNPTLASPPHLPTVERTEVFPVQEDEVDNEVTDHRDSSEKNGSDSSNGPTVPNDLFVEDSEVELVVLDFESNEETDLFKTGDIVDTEYQSVGVTFSSTSSQHPLMIFDTENPTGGDFDLRAPENIGDRLLGNVLIISEDGDSQDPDDNAAGGTIQIQFDQLTRVHQVGILDIDSGHTGGTIQMFDDGNNIIKSVEIEDLGNNTLQDIMIDVDNVSHMHINFVSSGALAYISFDDFASTNTIFTETDLASGPNLL